MSEKDIRELLDYEYNKGTIRKLNEKEVKEFVKEYNKELNNSDYYCALDEESDAAYSWRDDLFTEKIEKYKV